MSLVRADIHKYNAVKFFVLNLSQVDMLTYNNSLLTLLSCLTIKQTFFHFNY